MEQNYRNSIILHNLVGSKKIKNFPWKSSSLIHTIKVNTRKRYLFQKQKCTISKMAMK